MIRHSTAISILAYRSSGKQVPLTWARNELSEYSMLMNGDPQHMPITELPEMAPDHHLSRSPKADALGIETHPLEPSLFQEARKRRTQFERTQCRSAHPRC